MRRMFRTLMALFLTVLIGFGFYVGQQIYIKNRYPLKYKEDIEVYAKAYALDPYLVASVIWVESKFDAQAESGKGALGLMQIMPETGGWIAEKLGEKDFSPEDLRNPQTSIAFGCWYLNYLSGRFSGEMKLVLAAYNSGPARVDEWIANDDYTEQGNLVNIPYSETDDFVKRVEKTYEIYKKNYTFYDQN